MCLSEEIRTAVDFDNLDTVDKALYDIKAYMINSVMPFPMLLLMPVFQSTHMRE